MSMVTELELTVPNGVAHEIVYFEDAKSDGVSFEPVVLVAKMLPFGAFTVLEATPADDCHERTDCPPWGTVVGFAVIEQAADGGGGGGGGGVATGGGGGMTGGGGGGTTGGGDG